MVCQLREMITITCRSRYGFLIAVMLEEQKSFFCRYQNLMHRFVIQDKQWMPRFS